MTPPSDLNNAGGALSPVENPSRALQPRPMVVHPIAVSQAPPALSSAPNALSLLKALRHRLGIALTVGSILAGIVAAAVWFFLPHPKPTARMQLHVEPMKPTLLFNEEPDLVEIHSFLRTQAFIIRDRFSLMAVVRNPEIAKLQTIQQQADPVQWLEDNISVENPNHEFIQIHLKADNTDDALKIVAAVTQTYLKNYANKEQNDRDEHLKKLKGVGDDWKRKLERLKADAKAQQTRTGSLTEESVVLFQQLQREEIENVKRQIAQVREKILVLSVEMGLNPDWESKVWPAYAAVLNCQPGPGLPIHHAVVALLHDEYLIASANPNAFLPSEAELDAAIEKDEEISKIQIEIGKLREFIARNKAIVRQNHLEQRIKGPIEQVKKLEKRIEERRKTLRAPIVAAMRHRLLNTAKGERNKTDASYRGSKMLEGMLVERLKVLSQNQTQKLQDAGTLLQTLKEIEQFEKLVQKTEEEILKKDVEQHARSRITLPSKDPILVPVDETKRKLMITGGSSAAVLVVVLLAFSWFEFQSRKVYSPNEVVQDLGFQLMGTVPDHSPRGWLPWSRGSEVNSAYTQSMLTESVDSARTMLLHMASREQLQIVMITSALSGEGKTSLASHLAASLARAGRRTILVDSDLRNPTLHRLFERDRAPGLSELLRGETDLANVIGETAVPNLWLIPAGRADGTALQALALDSIPKLFERLRLHYDFVLVDSCPVLPVADAALVGQHVDGVIFSLLRQVSRMPRVYTAYQRLAVLGIRMLGAVVNGIQHDQYPSDYHYLGHEQEND